MRRYLFVISETGSGHRSAAEAVRQAMLERHPRDVRIDVADIFAELERWPYDHFAEWYRHLTRLQSLPWGAIYHLTDGPRTYAAIEGTIWPTVRKPLLRFLRRHPADVIVTFHPILNRSLGRALRELGKGTPLVGVAVDLVQVHAAFWTPDLYRAYVPLEVSRRNAIAQGGVGSRIEVLGGMPVRPAFREARALDQAEVREQLGLDPHRPVVLVTAGGDGMGLVKHTTEELLRQCPEAQLVAVAGRNHELYRELGQIAPRSRLHVKGFVHDMARWMRAADVIVTKAGPNTVCEALVLGLPLVMHTQLRGQEAGTAQWVCSHGAGLWEPRARAAALAVRSLLAAPATRQAMSLAAQRLIDPYVAERLGQALWALAANRRPDQDSKLELPGLIPPLAELPLA